MATTKQETAYCVCAFYDGNKGAAEVVPIGKLWRQNQKTLAYNRPCTVAWLTGKYVKDCRSETVRFKATNAAKENKYRKVIVHKLFETEVEAEAYARNIAEGRGFRPMVKKNINDTPETVSSPKPRNKNSKVKKENAKQPKLKKKDAVVTSKIQPISALCEKYVVDMQTSVLYGNVEHEMAEMFGLNKNDESGKQHVIEQIDNEEKCDNSTSNKENFNSLNVQEDIKKTMKKKLPELIPIKISCLKYPRSNEQVATDTLHALPIHPLNDKLEDVQTNKSFYNSKSMYDSEEDVSSKKTDHIEPVVVVDKKGFMQNYYSTDSSDEDNLNGKKPVKSVVATRRRSFLQNYLGTDDSDEGEEPEVTLKTNESMKNCIITECSDQENLSTKTQQGANSVVEPISSLKDKLEEVNCTTNTVEEPLRIGSKTAKAKRKMSPSAIRQKLFQIIKRNPVKLGNNSVIDIGMDASPINSIKQMRMETTTPVVKYQSSAVQASASSSASSAILESFIKRPSKGNRKEKTSKDKPQKESQEDAYQKQQTKILQKVLKELKEVKEAIIENHVQCQEEPNLQVALDMNETNLTDNGKTFTYKSLHLDVEFLKKALAAANITKRINYVIEARWSDIQERVRYSSSGRTNSNLLGVTDGEKEDFVHVCNCLNNTIKMRAGTVTKEKFSDSLSKKLKYDRKRFIGKLLAERENGREGVLPIANDAVPREEEGEQDAEEGEQEEDEEEEEEERLAVTHGRKTGKKRRNVEQLTKDTWKRIRSNISDDEDS